MKSKNEGGCLVWGITALPFVLIVMGLVMEFLSFMTVQDVKKATVQTTAMVISEEYRTELDTSKDYDDPDRRERVRYVTITFTINGEQRWKSGKNDNLQVGEKLIAWYDPDDTSKTNDHVYIEGYDDFGGISLLGLMPLALGIGLAVYIFFPRKKKSEAAKPDTDMR